MSVKVRRRFALVSALAFIAIIGWLDYATGPDVGFSLVYLAPVALVAWVVGDTEALICAITAALSWFIADALWRPSSLMLSVWNGFTRLVIYMAVA